jgi:hypothetical protein
MTARESRRGAEEESEQRSRTLFRGKVCGVIGKEPGAADGDGIPPLRCERSGLGWAGIGTQVHSSPPSLSRLHKGRETAIWSLLSPQDEDEEEDC